MSAELSFVGVATVFGRVPGRAEVLDAERFGRWLDDRWGVPLRWSHTALITANGAVRESVGTCRRFAVADLAPIRVLVTYGTFAEDWESRQLAESVRADVASRAFRWGLSIGVGPYGHDSVSEAVYEVSLVSDPAIPETRVLAIGEAAGRVWERLTGEPAPVAEVPKW